MLTPAQQKFLELRQNGIHAAIFEGMWSAGGMVFELGEKLAAASPDDKCGFITYEGEEFFYKILNVHRFEQSSLSLSLRKPTSSSKIESGVSFEQYAKNISQILELIKSGETYQVNYSIPFQVVAQNLDPFTIYCDLFALNPSPYSCYMETENGALISNSPECLMRLEESGHITTIPIKGTIAAHEPDEKLLLSEKNKAELVMIVDLERNDLGKVCTYKSVRVSEHRKVEQYSHVKHTASVIEGQLAPTKTWRDALEALFPGGSVTGCPKKRTMEIIEQFEVGARGIYCGSAGFVLGANAHQNAVFNILIRSLWFDTKTRSITFRSGGGIVFDSDAESEYTELLNKAAAIISVLNRK